MLDLPEAALPGAQPRPARPRLRPARHPPAAQPAAAVAARAEARGLPPRLRALDARGGRRGRASSGSRSGTTASTSTARSTSSATSTAAATSCRRCCGSWATRRRATTERCSSTGIRKGARRSSSATWSTAGPTIAGRAAAGDGDGRGGHGALRARQPRHEADAQAAGPRRADHARAGRVAGAARSARPPEFTQRGRRRSSTAWSATTCSTTASWSSRTPGMKEEMQGRGSGAGARLRAVRRDDRRDRRVRPAGALQLGGRVPRPGDGRLRPHAGARAGVAQPHDQHRHRLRLRRQADGAALPGARAGLGAGRAQTYCRAGPAVPARRRSRRR